MSMPAAPVPPPGPPPSLPHVRAPSLQLPGIMHGFFGRRGGVSTGLYASLNTGPGSDDDPQAVAQNRARAVAALGLGADRLVTLHQVHSARAITLTAPFSHTERPQADALVTNTPGLAIAALAADCAPVLMADPEAGVIAAVHAGWRGALSGVTDAALEAMQALGARPAHIRAVIGPCIGQAAYEVGPEFEAEFVSADAKNAGFFAPGQSDRRHFDLTGYVASRLHARAIGDVTAVHHCTCTDEDGYFSNRRRTRRGESDYGRNISIIALDQAMRS